MHVFHGRFDGGSEISESDWTILAEDAEMAEIEMA
jgi:hypothetical protein